MSAVAEAKPVAKPTVEEWYTVTELMEITKFGRTFLYSEIDRGALRSKKVGGSRRISAQSLAEWQASFDGSGEIDAD